MPSHEYIRHGHDFLDHVEGLMMHGAAAAHSGIHFYMDGYFNIRLFAAFLQSPGKPEIGNRRCEIIFDDLASFHVR